MTGPALAFVPSLGQAGPPHDRRRVVLDTAWTPAPDDPVDALPLREPVAAVLRREDLFARADELLDGWEAASGVAELMTVDGISFWYGRRLGAWRWLHERLLWLAVLDELLSDGPFGRFEVPSSEPALVETARLVARRDGLGLAVRPVPGAGTAASPGGAGPVWLSRLAGAARRRLLAPLSPALRARRRAIARRVEELAAEGGGRLLVLADPRTRQTVETEKGPRQLDPFLGPIVAELAGTALDPVVLELAGGLHDDATWARLDGPDGARSLPADLLAWHYGRPGDDRRARAGGEAIAVAVERATAPLVVGEIDLGRALAAEVARHARRGTASRLRETWRAGRFLLELRPAAILLIDEYGRTEWLAAGRATGIPVAAVQHGIIHRRHPGYRHAARPASLALPARTYLFGEFERRLLTTESVYRDDELRVAGSPRLDLQRRPTNGERERLRAELGVAPGDRMVVLTTTNETVIRRFYLPALLAAMVDRPLPRVHLVVKLHPAEREGEPYRRLVEGLGRVRAFVPPPLTIVRDVDLYRLLGAADAHLGLYSTVLTEAVVTATPNLVAATQATSDLVGCVAAGVALPVRDGASLLAALEAIGAGAPRPEARDAFLADHFAFGRAGQRISDDLLAWLAPAGSSAASQGEAPQRAGYHGG